MNEKYRTQQTGGAEKPMKLEEAMSRLDAIVSELDRTGEDLETSLRLYEEGVALIRLCREQLKEAEQTVRVLRMSADGEITEEPLDAE